MNAFPSVTHSFIQNRCNYADRCRTFFVVFVLLSLLEIEISVKVLTTLAKIDSVDIFDISVAEHFRNGTVVRCLPRMITLLPKSRLTKTARILAIPVN